MKEINTKDLVLLSILIALNVVLSRLLSISAWNFKIGLTFLSIYIASYFYGWLGGLIVGGLGDLIGSLLFPIGAYFPGFTITAALSGVAFGLIINKSDKLLRITLACFCYEVIFSLLINSFFISYLYNNLYSAILLSRIPQCIIMIFVEIIVIKLLATRMKGFHFERN